MKQRLNAEIKALEQQTPVAIAKPICQRGTRVGKLMANLSATTEPKEVKTLTSLTEAEKTRLASLKTDLAADPARAARQSQSLKTKLNKGIGCLERLIAAVADDNIAALGQAFRAFVAAQAAAQAASRSLFSQEPLPDIGSDIWQALWGTARKYSETSAYPMQAFPVTEDGTWCVLCFQKLNAEATERFNLFEAFVKNESKRREAEAKATYERALETFNQVHIPHTERITIAALVENDLGNAVLAKDLRRSIAASLWRLRHVARRQQQPEQQAVPPIIELLISPLCAR